MYDIESAYICNIVSYSYYIYVNVYMYVLLFVYVTNSSVQSYFPVPIIFRTLGCEDVGPMLLVGRQASAVIVKKTENVPQNVKTHLSWLQEPDCWEQPVPCYSTWPSQAPTLGSTGPGQAYFTGCSLALPKVNIAACRTKVIAWNGPIAQAQEVLLVLQTLPDGPKDFRS